MGSDAASRKNRGIRPSGASILIVVPPSCIAPSGVDLLTDSPVTGALELPPSGYAVIRSAAG